MVGQQLTQLDRTRGGDGGAGGVLGAGGHHDGPRAATQRPCHIVGQRSVVVDPYWLDRKAQRGKQIQKISPPRVLDRHPVARP